MSRVPFEQMMAMCSMGARTFVSEGAAAAAAAPVVVLMLTSSFRAAPSDAALGLRQPRDARRQLPRALGEELVEPLHVHARLLRDAPHGGRLPLALGVGAAELDDLPVIGRQRHARLGGDGLADLARPLGAVH